MPVILANAAARTSSIRLGIAVVVLPWHNPLEVAEDLATLDVLSNGRLDAGFGRGLFPEEFRFFDVSLEEGKPRFEESIEFIIRAWRDETAELDGRFWKIPEIELLPKPLQKPTPRIWEVALSPPTIETVIRRGANGLIGPYLTPLTEVKENFLDVWRQKIAEAGLKPGDRELGHNQHVYVAATDEQARAEAREHLVWYCRTLSSCLPGWEETRGTPFEYYTQWKEQLLELDGEPLLGERAVIGSPETVIEKIRYLEQEGGMTTFIPFMNFGTMPLEMVKQSMTLFAEEVMPAFARSETSSSV
jgi:alkanesulfonate monooxygenase SsuD/methylene tetrahydromethanopterin reductase-like flavin-dependent oxidoreductase (luciferase family)